MSKSTNQSQLQCFISQKVFAFLFFKEFFFQHFRDAPPLNTVSGLLDLSLFWLLLLTGSLILFVWTFGNKLLVIFHTQVNLRKSYHPLVRFKRKLRLSTFKSIDNTVVNTSLLYYKLIRQRFLRLTKKSIIGHQSQIKMQCKKMILAMFVNPFHLFFKCLKIFF